jgi:hypothetical protein
MYGAINPPTTGEKTFAAFAASVPNSNEPGFGITAPFTPTTANSTTNPSVTEGSTSRTATGTGATSTGTDVPGGAMAVSVRSGVVVALAGVVASLVL